jgi:hypothetical protein
MSGHVLKGERTMPYHEGDLRLAELVGSLQMLLLSTDDIEPLLARAVSVASDVVGPAAAGSITMRRDGCPVTVASSDPRAVEADQVQYDVGVGPCLESLATGVVVDVPDHRQEDRWPRLRRFLGPARGPQLAQRPAHRRRGPHGRGAERLRLPPRGRVRSGGATPHRARRCAGLHLDHARPATP